MTNLVTMWQLLFAWLPVPFQVIVLGFFAFLIIYIVVKLVGFILNAIPFL